MAENEKHVLWENNETVSLIEVWGDAEIQQQFEGATRNIKVFIT